MAPAAPLTSDSSWQAYVHRPVQSERRTILAALIADADANEGPEHFTEPHPSRKLASKLTGCCQAPTIHQDDETGQIVTASDSCNSRICPRCSRRRGAELRQVIDGHARRLDWPAMVTLTIRADGMRLSEGIDHLQESFKRLRRNPAWKSHVFGGVAALEIKWSGPRQAWHPHLHILADMIYWPQAELAQAWEKASQGSRICDVRRVSGPAEAANYVAKYVSKAQHACEMPARCIAEWAHALHGRRMAQPFGHLHGSKTRLPRPERPGQLEMIGHLPVLQEASAAHDLEAHELLTAVLNRRQIDSPDPAGGPSADDLAADRELAEQLRDWFQRREGAHRDATHARHDPGPKRDRANHRAERLWQDKPAHPDVGCGL
jgi:hypothetical protein